MIVKIERYNKYESQDKELIFNVERASTFIDENGNIILSLKIKGNENIEFIALTYTDKDDNHPSIASAVWLMNNDGKTIERIL